MLAVVYQHSAPFQAKGPVLSTPVKLAGKKLMAHQMVRKQTQRGNSGTLLLSDRPTSAAATICIVVHAYCRSMHNQPVSVSSCSIAGSRSGRNAATAQNIALNDTT